MVAEGTRPVPGHGAGTPSRGRLLGLHGIGVAVLVAVGVTGRPLPWETGDTTWALAGLYLVVCLFPIVTGVEGREEVVLLQEIPLVAGFLVLPPASVFWAAVAGMLMSRLLVPFVAPLERMRRAGWRRHAANVSIEAVGLAPAYALLALAPDEPAVLPYLLATVAGFLFASTTAATIDVLQGTRRPGVGRISTFRPTHPRLWAAGSLAGLLLGEVLRDPGRPWMTVLLVVVGIVALSRGVLRRQVTNDRLGAVAAAAEQSSRAQSPSDIDASVLVILQGALRTSAVRFESAPPGDGAIGAPVAQGAGRWLVAGPRASGAPFTDDDRALISAVAAIVGPTRDRLYLMDRLRETEAFKSLLLAAAGHDLGNRLTAAKIGVQLLATRTEASDSPRTWNAVRQSTAAIESASAMLEDLLELTRMERSTHAVQEIDGAALRRFIDRLGLDHPVDVDAAPGVRTRVHHIAVERAVENLLRNADRYHDGDEPLRVALCDMDDRTHVIIEDRGPGLPPTQVQQLFEPFSQVGTSRDRHGGVGLGLYLARGFVEAVGGTLHYEARSGGGARFVLDLPRAQARTAASS